MEDFVKENTVRSKLPWFPPWGLWIGIVLMMGARAWLSWDLLETYNYVFSLSADDMARARLAMLWSQNPSLFVEETWPPLPFYIGGILNWFITFDLGALCLVNVICSLLSIALLGYSAWWLVSLVETKVFHAAVYSTVAMAVFVFFPHWVWLGTSMLAEPLYILCLLAAIYLFRLALIKKCLGWSFGALAACILANMTRLEGLALTGIVYALLVVRLFDRRSLRRWLIFAGCGLLLFLLFPAAWAIYQAGGSRGIVGYFEALRGGFTSKYAYDLLKTPVNLIILYAESYTFCLVPSVLGFAVAMYYGYRYPEQRWVVYEGILISFYVLAQLVGSALGLMPTHNFWRLTVPVYVLMLPYLAYALVQLGRFVPVWIILVPTLLLFVNARGAANPNHVFVTPSMFETAEIMLELLGNREDPGEVLLEIDSWDWYFFVLRIYGTDLNALKYDRNRGRHYPQYRRESVFFKQPEAVQNYMDEKNVEFAIVRSDLARQKLNILGWKHIYQETPFSIYKSPANQGGG